MRITPDLSGNGMGAAWVQQAYLEEIINTSNRISESVRVVGNFNVTITGTFNGSIALQRSLDNGATWQALTGGGSEIAVFTSAANESYYEPEPQALYRFNFIVFVSGSATVRLGK